MRFKKGHLIKPQRTTVGGSVVFTNGTETCNPNEGDCIAYGYTWDRQTKTCRAFPANKVIAVANTTLIVGNKSEGVRNTVEAGSYYNNTNGVDNSIGKGVQNSTVSGRGNHIDDYVQDASVSGSYAKIQRQGEIGLGGGNYEQTANHNGYAQSSTIHCATRTSGAGTFIAGVAGISGTAIPVQTHSVIIFTLTGTAINEAGGSSWGFFSKHSITMANNRQATQCNFDSGVFCGPPPEGWTMPVFLQLSVGGAWGDLQLNVQGVAGQELTYNIKLELIETRTINDF